VPARRRVLVEVRVIGVLLGSGCPGSGPRCSGGDRGVREVKSAVETLSPTRVKLTVEVPFDELKPELDAAYQHHRQPDPGPRLPQGQGAHADHRPARRVAARCSRRPSTRRCRGSSAEAIEERTSSAARPARGRGDRGAARGRRGLRLHRRGRRAPGDRPCPTSTGSRSGRRRRRQSDDDVEERLTVPAERFGTLVGVDRAVEDGDFVSIDLSAAIDGEEIDAVEGISYEVGSGKMLPGMDEALVGMSAGETKTFTAPLAGGDHEGQDAECTVTVQSVKVRELPELDDEFAQLASEFDTLEELRPTSRSQAEQSQEVRAGHPGPRQGPRAPARDRRGPGARGHRRGRGQRSHLEGENRLDDDEHRAEVDENTRKALKAQFLLDAIAEKLEVNVEQPELIEYLIMSAQQYGMDPNQFAQAIDSRARSPRWSGGRPPQGAGRRARAGVVTDTSRQRRRPQRARPCRRPRTTRRVTG
jgi:trigger factor